MDVVIPVREHGPGEPREGDELTYVLRSFAAHLPHDRVWLFGGTQPWLRGVEHVPFPQLGTKWENAKKALRLACRHGDVSDPFLLANDDMFAMRPVPVPPAYALGTLTEMLRSFRSRSAYTEAAVRTREVLHVLGASGWAFEAHVPLVVDKGGMLAALARCADDPRLYERSLYGNLVGLEPTRLPGDVKVYRAADSFPSSVGWVSTTELSFTRTPHGDRIRSAFPWPCRYETEETC